MGKKVTRKAWLGGLALGVLCALVLAWTWYTTRPDANGRSRYEIVNDEYSTVVAPIDAQLGLWQAIAPDAGTTLYGVRLLPTTYNRVAQGTFYLELQADDVTLATAQCDMTTLLDNTFVGMIFDRPVTIEAGVSYQLYLHSAPATGEDKLGFWCAERTLPGYALSDPLSSNMPSTPGTLALQWVSDYTGRWFDRLFWLPGALLALAVLGSAWLIARGKSRAAVFGWAGAVLGLCFVLVTPPLAAPDEYTHLAASYAMASEWLGQPTYAEDGALYMRACDAPYMTDVTGEADMFAYKRLATGLGSLGNDGTAATPVQVSAPYKPVPLLYLAQAAGVALARLVGLGFFGMQLCGRLANLLIYLLLAGFAVRRCRRAGEILFCTALLPMSLQLAGSFSPDALTLGLCFALSAQCLSMAFEEAPLRWVDVVVLALLAALLAPCKAVYVLLVGLCFLIPAARFGGPGRAWLARICVCAAAAASWCFYNSEYFLYVLRDVSLPRLALGLLALAALLAGLGWAWQRLGRNPQGQKCRRWLVLGVAVLSCAALAVLPWLLHLGGNFTPEQLAAGIKPNGDSVYTYSLGYLLRHLPTAAKLLVATLATQLPTLLQGLVGTLLSEPIVYHIEASWIYTLGLILLLGVAALRAAEQPRRLPNRGVWLCGGIAAGVFLLCAFACLTWTPINYTELFGLQGRYLLPVLPLALLCLGENEALCQKRDLSAGVRLGSVSLTALVLLQGLCLYAVR